MIVCKAFAMEKTTRRKKAINVKEQQQQKKNASLFQPVFI